MISLCILGPMMLDCMCNLVGLRDAQIAGKALLLVVIVRVFPYDRSRWPSPMWMGNIQLLKI